MLDDLLKNVLNEKTAGWSKMLSDKAGFSADQAKSFIPALIEKVTALFKGGKIDLKGLDVSKLMGQLNVGELAKKAGVDATKASEGLKAVLPDILKQVQDKAGDAKGLVEGAKGLMGKLGLGGKG